MIHYHGTPISGSRQEASRFLVGRHALVPFKSQDDINAVLEFSQSFVFDNSAFSYCKSGKGDVDVKSYFEWVHRFQGHPNLDWCLIPDKIDGTEEQNKLLVKQWLGLYPKVKSVPVWHMHDSLEWLDYLSQTFITVALGSSGQYAHPGTNKWWGRMSEAMDVVCDSDGRAKCKLHGLRMLNPEIFTKLPLTSADSTNAAVNAGSLKRFGMYMPTTSSQRASVIADRIEMYNSAPVWKRGSEQESLDLFNE